jgi:hypothetical protein
MDQQVESLKDTIELNYHCRAEHVASAAVIEMSGGEQIWQGMVDVFEVACHLPVKRCYAWSQGAGPAITVLELPPVRSAGTAVHAALASEGNPVGQPSETQPAPWPSAAEIDERMFAFGYECSSNCS